VATQIEIERSHPDAAASRTSLFDRSDWLYAFMRERCFRDDTARIEAALWGDGSPDEGTRLVDIGCGPGTYARRLAQRHPRLHAIGIDRSPRQVHRARERARRAGTENCHFELGDALRLPLAAESIDAVIASRLFMVLSDPARALAEIYRILRPGGRCFIAEPRPGLWTALPTMALRMVNGVAGETVDPPRVPDDDVDWAALLDTQPWSYVIRSGDRRYRYAVSERSQT